MRWWSRTTLAERIAEKGRDRCPSCGHATERPADPAWPLPRTCTVCWGRDSWLRARWAGGGVARHGAEGEAARLDARTGGAY